MVMEFIREVLVFGINGLILHSFIKKYFETEKMISILQTTPEVQIDSNLEELVRKNDPLLKYVMIRGTVQPETEPLKSIKNPFALGVLQTITVSEHVANNSSVGISVDHQCILQEVKNEVPFLLSGIDNVAVRVHKPFDAHISGLQVTSDFFDSAASNRSLERILDVFGGIRMRGYHTTEKMLPPGTYLIGIGEVVLSPEGHLQLQQPSNGNPYFLINFHVGSAIRKFQEQSTSYKCLSCLLAGIGLILGYMLIRRAYNFVNRKINERDFQKKLRFIRANRQKRMDDGELPDDVPTCVVCLDNPREMILLPCGHICLCADCVEHIHRTCPLCRCVIENKAPAYLYDE